MIEDPSDQTEPRDDPASPDATGPPASARSLAAANSAASEAPYPKANRRSWNAAFGQFRQPRKRTLWYETCNTGKRPALGEPMGSIADLLGIVIIVMLLVFLVTLRTGNPVPPAATTAQDPLDSAGNSAMTSEAGMDRRAQRAARELRAETERRLAQSDEWMIRRLDDWRHQLATFQDMTVELAGVGTGGGSWVSHEGAHNDLELESSLLDPQAEALAAIRTGDPPPDPADPDEARQRAADWQALWSRFDALATALRMAGLGDDLRERHLDGLLRQARTAHHSLAVMLDDLDDPLAARAVVDYCTAYFADTTRGG